MCPGISISSLITIANWKLKCFKRWILFCSIYLDFQFFCVLGGTGREQADGNLGGEHQGLEQLGELPAKRWGDRRILYKRPEKYLVIKKGGGEIYQTPPLPYANHYKTSLHLESMTTITSRVWDSKGWTTWQTWTKRWLIIITIAFNFWPKKPALAGPRSNMVDHI